MAKRSNLAKKLALVPAEPLKLDIGAGMRKQPGFQGVDIIPFAGIDHVMDVRKAPWKWANESVGEVFCSHFLEHLTAVERIVFYNELYRVLIPGGKCQIIVPHWASNRAYGDPTHQWPPVSEMAWYYLSKEWRSKEAPHTDKANWKDGFDCDFVATWGYGLRQDLTVRSEEFRQNAVANYKEAITDMICTLTATKA